MKTLEVSSNLETLGAASASRWSRLDAWMERAGERLNPILVKEARQALKSRQFITTFNLLLACGWGWSLLAIAMGQSNEFAAYGASTFIGYYIILCVPLLIVVPFAAYQSIGSERQDGTFELLSITALSARQIVVGKLCGSLLQMMVYFSALAPCIAFTYLLRGIEIPTIFVALLYAFLLSVLFSSVGLLLGAMTRHTHIQAGVSALFVVSLVVATWLALLAAVGILFNSAALPYDLSEFWIGNLAASSLLISFVVLCVVAAASAISFASANRSTPIRYVMLAQQVLFTGWYSYLFLIAEDTGTLAVGLALAAVYWAVMGALMTGENGELSPRARRTLPQTALGRITLTWLTPGSGTGYVFAICNMAAITMLATCLPLFTDRTLTLTENAVLLGWVLLAYLTLYLGIGRLAIRLFRRRRGFFPVPMGLFVHGFVFAAAAGVPPVVQMLLGDWYLRQYTLLQGPNWAWTISELARPTPVPELQPALLSVGGCAVVMLLVNLHFAAHEAAQQRAATPERVLADQQSRAG